MFIKLCVVLLQFQSIGEMQDRILALEESQTTAQEKADMAITTAQQLKDSDLHAVTDLHTLQSEMSLEINTKVAQLQEMGVSVASLSALLANQTKELEAVKQSVSEIVSSNAKLALSISGLSNSISGAESMLDQQGIAVDDLSSQLQEQANEIHSLREFLSNQQATLESSNQEVMELKYVKTGRPLKIGNALACRYSPTVPYPLQTKLRLS